MAISHHLHNNGTAIRKLISVGKREHTLQDMSLSDINTNLDNELVNRDQISYNRFAKIFDYIYKDVVTDLWGQLPITDDLIGYAIVYQ